jgi:hypothetical protein
MAVGQSSTQTRVINPSVVHFLILSYRLIFDRIASAEFIDKYKGDP